MCPGLFVVLLGTTLVNTAMPSNFQGIDASLEEFLRVLNAYVLIFAVGRRRKARPE